MQNDFGAKSSTRTQNIYYGYFISKKIMGEWAGMGMGTREIGICMVDIWLG